MVEQGTFEHLLALKAELEALGCTVTITPEKEPEEDSDALITVRITYPSDVPPPAVEVLP